MATSSATFGPQWPYANPYIVTLVRKDGLRLPIHKELVALVAMLMDLTEMMLYDIKPGQTWGYANRPISGTDLDGDGDDDLPSNHSRGCSVDLNAPANPMASALWHRTNATSRPFGLPRHCDIPEKVFKLWEAHGFVLGVKYEKRPDPMHFEFVLSVTQARKITADLKAYLAHAPSAPAPTLEYDMKTLDLRTADQTAVNHKDVNKLKLLMVPWLDLTGNADDAKLAQALIDGRNDTAGARTKQALIRVQEIMFYLHALTTGSANGVCGPATWKALIEG